MLSLPDTAARAARDRRAASRSEPALAIGLGWAVGFGLLGWLALLTVLPYQGVRTQAALLAFIVGPAAGLWWVAKAGARAGRYAMGMVVAVVLVSDLSLRGRVDGIDAQSVVKFAVWMSGLLLLPWRAGVLRLATRDLSTFALLLFGLWALASTVYSISPRYTLAASLCFLGIWCTAVVVATTVDTTRSLLWVAGTLWTMAASSLLMLALAPSAAMVLYENSTTLRLGGVFGNANALGGVCSLALLLVVLAWFSPVDRRVVVLTLLVVPVCLACLVLTQSRTSMLALAAAIAAVTLRRHPFLLLPGVLLGAMAVVVLMGYPGAVDGVVGLVARAGRVEQVSTFTGRTEIWAFVVSAIRDAPVLGYGFASTKELIPAGYAGPYGWTTASAHNLWLQTWVTTGVVGLALVVASQLGSLKALVMKPLPLRDGVCVYVLFFGLLEPGPMGPSVNLLTFLWIWATASSLRVGVRTRGAVS